MTAHTFETDSDAYFAADSSSDYQLAHGIEEGMRVADDDQGSVPSTQSGFRPRTRPLYIHQDPSAGLVEIIKQRWSGSVIAFENDEIQARIEDLTDPSRPDELVTLAIEEIDRHEQSLIQLGAMFFWHIGYRQGPKYPKERFSKIRFRRLPNWTEGELVEAKEKAKKYTDFFDGDKDYTA